MAARQTMKETRTAETASRQRSRFTGILFTLISAVGFGITPMLASGVLGAGMDPIALDDWKEKKEFCIRSLLDFSKKLVIIELTNVS